MTETHIGFEIEKKGYKREQVDSYIKKLSDAYQTTYDEYQEINNKYNELLEYCGNTSAQLQPSTHAAIMANTLKYTEILAQKIIADAQAEASQILTDAQNAKNEVETVVSEAKETAQNIIMSAETDAAMVAIQVRKNLELAYNTMGQAASEVERIFEYRIHENENALIA